MSAADSAGTNRTNTRPMSVAGSAGTDRTHSEYQQQVQLEQTNIRLTSVEARDRQEQLGQTGPEVAAEARQFRQPRVCGCGGGYRSDRRVGISGDAPPTTGLGRYANSPDSGAIFGRHIHRQISEKMSAL